MNKAELVAAVAEKTGFTKKDAEVVATICGDPFIAVGRYGEGKSAVVSTDCSPHWAPPEFCEWKHYNTLVKNLLDFLTEK